MDEEFSYFVIILTISYMKKFINDCFWRGVERCALSIKFGYMKSLFERKLQNACVCNLLFHSPK